AIPALGDAWFFRRLAAAINAGPGNAGLSARIFRSGGDAAHGASGASRPARASRANDGTDGGQISEKESQEGPAADTHPAGENATKDRHCPAGARSLSDRADGLSRL